MESNFGGFTPKGQNEFIQTMRDLLAYKVLQNSLGGYVARKFEVRKVICAVDEIADAITVDSKRIACHITNAGSVPVYLRHVDENPMSNNAATIISYGYPLAVGATLNLEGVTNSVYATGDGGATNLRVIDIIDDKE